MESFAPESLGANSIFKEALCLLNVFECRSSYSKYSTARCILRFFMEFFKGLVRLTHPASEVSSGPSVAQYVNTASSKHRKELHKNISVFIRENWGARII